MTRTARICRPRSTTPPSSTTRTTAAIPAPTAGRRTAVDDFRQMINFDELTSDDTITLARAAAEAIRGLNWATATDAGLDQPSVAYDILSALSLDRALAAGRLGHDLGEDPALAIGAADIFLGDAAAGAAALAGDIDAAQQQLALVNGRPARPGRKDTP